jgi:hypothetical protein
MSAENDSGSTPSQTDLQSWATQYGLTMPVVADQGWAVFDAIWGGGYTPANALLAPGMKLVTTDWVGDADIEAVLPE